MLGPNVMVAPMVDTGTSWKLQFPEGEWLGADGKIYSGKLGQTIDVPIDEIPYFYKKINKL